MKIAKKRPAIEMFDDIVNRLKEQLIQCQTDTNELVFRLRDFVQTELDINRIKSNRWIPVEDALPDTFIYVICAGEEGMGVLRYNGDVWVDDTGCIYPMSAITHWMHLPEPPEKECNDGT